MFRKIIILKNGGAEESQYEGIETNLYLTQGTKRKGKEQVGRRTEVCFSDFTPASKLLEVSRLIIFVSILLQRSSGDLGGRYLLLSATHP